MYIQFLQMDVDLFMVPVAMVFLYLFITTIFTWIWYTKKSYKKINKNKDLIYTSASAAMINIDDEEGDYVVDLNTLVADPSTNTVTVTI